MSTNQAKLTRYSRIDGAACQEAVARKMRKYKQVARSLGISFSPLAVEGGDFWQMEQQGLMVHHRQSCLLCSNMGW